MAIIQLPEIVNPPNVNEAREFIKSPVDFLTVDFKKVGHFNLNSLEILLQTAYLTHNSPGIVQFVNVNEGFYNSITNRKVAGQRPQMWTDIYTDRSQEDIGGILQNINTNYRTFGVTRKEISETLGAARREYDELLQYSEEDLSSQENDRRRKEYCLIKCIRLIESKKPDKGIVAHLRYNPNAKGRVTALDDLPDVMDNPPLQEKVRKTPHDNHPGEDPR